MSRPLPGRRVSVKSTICLLCQTFYHDLLQGSDESLGPRWVSLGWTETKPRNIKFDHHRDYSELKRSASRGCGTCRLMVLAWFNDHDGDNNSQIQLRVDLERPHYQGLLLEAAVGYRINSTSDRWFRLAPCTPNNVIQFYVDRQWYPFPGFDPLNMKVDISPARIEDCLSRSIPFDAMAESSLSVIHEWLKRCQKHHSCARIPHPVLPTRVVDVGSDDCASDPSLYIPRPGETGKYLALSYCWGESVSCITTSENIHVRRRGIPLSDLPKTLHDAIIITRKLGFRFLWIDALCILQDSLDDWTGEAEKMASIYEGSLFVISALDAKDSGDGMLKPRGLGGEYGVLVGNISDTETTLPVRARSRLRRFEEVLEASTLNRRAWALQERLLAPALLHFSSQQMFWECRTSYCAEDGECRALEPRMKYVGARSGETDTGTFDLDIVRGDNFEYWYRIIRDYTSRAVKFEKDRLPALLGLVQKFQESCDSIYISGLWHDDLDRGLLWQPKVIAGTGSTVYADLAESLIHHCPSWSWISVIGPVTWKWLSYARRVHTPFDLQVSLPDLPDSIPSTASLSHAPIQVTGHLQHTVYIPPSPGSSRGTLEENLHQPMSCLMDRARHLPRRCWCLRATTWEANQGQAVICLLLEKSGTIKHTFKRVGLAVTTVEPHTNIFKTEEKTTCWIC
jgi:Heterokaryon incompatibility protein (HET)